MKKTNTTGQSDKNHAYSVNGMKLLEMGGGIVLQRGV